MSASSENQASSNGASSNAEERIRIMLVDDEPDLATVISQLLQAKYDVLIASNGLEALERIDRYEPDLIIMDVMMPTINGFDTTRAIRKNAHFASVPVIFLTALGDNQSIQEGMLSGGDIFLQKPFQPEQLFHYVDDLLNRNSVTPRQKKYSVSEILDYYSSEGQQSEDEEEPSQAAAEGMDGQTVLPALSAQLSQIASEPRVRILVVDRDIERTRFVRAVLGDEFETVVTNDSDSSPDKIMAYQPDIVILDLFMPGLDGLHLSYLARVNKRLRGAKFIFCSEKTDRESVEQAFRLGAAEFIEKPYTADELQQKIRSVIRRADFRRIRKRLSYTEITRREN